jgi:hypothetical protein
MASVLLFGCSSVKKNTEAKLVSPSRGLAAVEDQKVIQTIVFTGKPGVLATASIIDNQNSKEDPSLLITHLNSTGQKQISIETKKLGIIINSSMVCNLRNQSSQLVKDSRGQLQYISYGCGRDQYTRTLTISYRGNQYVVSGFKLVFQDTLSNYHDECDYDLLTAKGTRNGKAVHIDTYSLPLDELEDSAHLYECNNW